MGPSCSKMAPRWPNIAQHSAKMSQHSFQEQPQDPKKPSKVMYCRRFFGFRHFWQDRPQDPKKVAKMLPNVRQVGHLSFQVGHLGPILAPSWPTWRHLCSNLAHLGAKMASKRPPGRDTFSGFLEVSRQTPQNLPKSLKMTSQIEPK